MSDQSRDVARFAAFVFAQVLDTTVGHIYRPFRPVISFPPRSLRLLGGVRSGSASREPYQSGPADPSESASADPSQSASGSPPPKVPEDLSQETSDSASQKAGDTSERGSKNPTPPAQPTRSTADRVQSGRIRKTWPRAITVTKSKGLWSEKNFCYRSSLLPCFLHQPAFARYLANTHALDCKPPCSVCSLQALFQEYWYPTSGRSSKGRLKRKVKNLTVSLLGDCPPGDPMHEDFKLMLQSDPYDFVNFILKRLQDTEMIDSFINPPKPDDDGDANDDQTAAFDYRALFDITATRTWTCQDCQSTHTTNEGATEVGVGLQVGLQDPKINLSLVEYLRGNVFNDTVEIRCANCGDKDKGKTRPRSLSITTAPELLILRLKRFAIDKGGGFVKLSNSCPFEQYLNLGEFTPSSDPLLYRLDGVVAHHGSIDEGHYIAAVRKQNGRTFCTINDERVLQPEEGGPVALLEDPKSEDDQFDPYVLVYSKV